MHAVPGSAVATPTPTPVVRGTKGWPREGTRRSERRRSTGPTLTVMSDALDGLPEPTAKKRRPPSPWLEKGKLTELLVGNVILALLV